MFFFKRLLKRRVPAADNAVATRPSAVGQEEVRAMRRETTYNPVLIKVGKVENHLMPGITIVGDMHLSEGGIRIKCRIDGSVVQTNESLVIIDKGGVINGDISARYLLVLGEVNGNIHAERVVVANSASIRGDVRYERTVGVINGAKVSGRLLEVLPPAPVLDEIEQFAAIDSQARNVFPFVQQGAKEELDPNSYVCLVAAN